MRHLKTDRLQHFMIFYIVTALLISCEKHPERPEGNSNKIEFSSIDTVTVSYRYGVITCRIENTEGNYISQHGFCWNTSSKPILSPNKTELGILNNPGIFSDTLTSLLPKTKYYVRAFAKVDYLIDPVYSNELSFTTRDDQGTLVDPRDGKTYNTIRIGDLWWMAENLNFYTNSGSWYYDNDSITYAETYGRLYTWETADSICPAGWHLPTDDEWKELEMELGMTPAQADNTGWRGTDQGIQLITGGNADFEALWAGFRFFNGSYYDLGSFAYFWSSTPAIGDIVWCRFLSKEINTGVNRSGFLKESGFSVRCVENDNIKK